MVFEFPELQGLIGGCYASAGGEPPAVAAAIRDHHLPTQQGTPIPATPESRILAARNEFTRRRMLGDLRALVGRALAEPGPSAAAQ